MQLFRASSSIASNYRAAGLGRSRREFTAKIGTVAEEADESLFWITFLARSSMLANGSDAEFASLSAEARSLVRIFVASYRTSKKRLEEAKRRHKAKAQAEADAAKARDAASDPKMPR
jgi:four helix bundle protein